MNTVSSKQRLKRGKVAALIGIACNLILAAAKLTVGLLFGALSVTADAVNNFFDATASIVTLVGFKIAEKPADAEHPYGHARFEYISGTVVAAMILFVGFELASSAVQKILHPTPVVFSVATIIVLVLSILVKLWLSIYNYRLGKAIGSATLRATATDARNDMLATAAVLIAVLVESFTSWQIDGFIGLGVAAFILYSGIDLLKDTANPLIGMGGNHALREEIVALVKETPKVLDCHDLLVHDYGPGNCFASIHVEMDHRDDPLQCHEIIDKLERRCLNELNVHLVVHYDPIALDDESLRSFRENVQQLLFDFDTRLLLHDFRTTQGKEHINLIFDIALPDDLGKQKTAIIDHVTNRLRDTDPTYYHIIITFDPS